MRLHNPAREAADIIAGASGTTSSIDAPGKRLVGAEHGRDPADWGRIAAMNALSEVPAMGRFPSWR